MQRRAKLALLLLCSVSGGSYAQIAINGPSCPNANKAEYPSLGFTICMPTAHKPLNARDFHPNTIFRIPGEQRAYRVVEQRKGEDACTGDRCYGQAMMGWTPKIWACARGVGIGVISSSIDARQSAFAGAALAHNDFTPHDAGHRSHWHGTAVLALLAGNPSGGVKGLVSEATFVVANVFFADTHGVPVADLVTLVKALNWMKSQKLQVILLDMAGSRDTLVDEAISDVIKTGAVVVMPAGTDENATSQHPGVITVAAVDKQMESRNDASRAGRIDLVAPGVDIWTALPGEKYGYVSGNSFAAAYAVAALAVAHRSVPDDAFAQEKRDQVLARLPVKDLGAGYGRGLVLAAKDCLPGLPSVSPLPMQMPIGDNRWRMSPVDGK